MTVKHKTEKAFETLDEIRKVNGISETNYYLIYNMFFNIEQQHGEELSRIKEELKKIKKVKPEVA